jgi:hypothetical protein
LIDPGAAANELVRHHVVGGETGNISDFETALAGRLLADVGETEAARRFVTYYISKCRRGFAPMAAILKRLVSELNIEGLPSWC